MEINLDKIPTRQKNMKLFEILLSESRQKCYQKEMKKFKDF